MTLTRPTTRERGRHRVEMVLAFLRGTDLRGRWRSGQQIVEHVKRESAATGEQTAYNSSNGAARNCHSLALRRGLAWWTLDVNSDETGPGNPGMGGHRLYCVMRRNEQPPHHPAMDNGAEPVGDPPLTKVGEDAKARTDATVQTLRDGRGGKTAGFGPAERGSNPRPGTDEAERRERHGGPVRSRQGFDAPIGDAGSTPSRPSHDGRQLREEPEPEGEQKGWDW